MTAEADMLLTGVEVELPRWRSIVPDFLDVLDRPFLVLFDVSVGRVDLGKLYAIRHCAT